MRSSLPSIVTQRFIMSWPRLESLGTWAPGFGSMGPWAWGQSVFSRYFLSGGLSRYRGAWESSIRGLGCGGGWFSQAPSTWPGAGLYLGSGPSGSFKVSGQSSWVSFFYRGGSQSFSLSGGLGLIPNRRMGVGAQREFLDLGFFFPSYPWVEGRGLGGLGTSHTPRYMERSRLGAQAYIGPGLKLWGRGGGRVGGFAGPADLSRGGGWLWQDPRPASPGPKALRPRFLVDGSNSDPRVRRAVGSLLGHPAYDPAFQSPWIAGDASNTPSEFAELALEEDVPEEGEAPLVESTVPEVVTRVGQGQSGPLSPGPWAPAPTRGRAWSYASWGGWSSMWLDTSRLPLCGPRPYLTPVGTPRPYSGPSDRIVGFWGDRSGQPLEDGGLGLVSAPPIFRMRPGYSTLWRGYRAMFAQVIQGRLWRQKHITRYVSGLARLKGSGSWCFLALRLLYVGPLVCWPSGSLSWILSGGLWVNGSRVRDPLFQLSPGDYVWGLGLAPRGGPVRGSGWGDGSGKVSRIPDFVEVDFSGSGLIVLFLPGPGGPGPHLPMSTLRLYNWKYVI